MDNVKKALASLLLFLFGASWKTTLIGVLTAAAVEMAADFNQLPGYGWHFVAAGILALARAAKDSGVTGGTVVAPNATVNVPKT